MDWPVVALITFIFALLFLLAYMIMRSYRGTKKKYAKLLDEKEKKLSRMQIDIEETMDGLEAYADELKNEWAQLRQKERESFSSIQEHGLKNAATLLELKGQLNAVQIKQRELERRLAEYEREPVEREKPRRAEEGTVLQMPRAVKAETAAPITVSEDAEAESAEADIAKVDAIENDTSAECAETASRDGETLEELTSKTEEAIRMLRRGMDIAATAQALGYSRGELDLLTSKMGRKRRQG